MHDFFLIFTAVAGAVMATGGLKWSLAHLPRLWTKKPLPVFKLLQKHFGAAALEKLTISQRQFPARVRVDLQRAIDRLLADPAILRQFSAVKGEYGYYHMQLTECVTRSDPDNPHVAPPLYEEFDIGDSEPVRCLHNGLWLIEWQGVKAAILLTCVTDTQQMTGVQFEIAVVNDPLGLQATQQFFDHLQQVVATAKSYRGKILSIEASPQSYSGQSTGITVHKLCPVERQDVILPAKTLELLDRNVIQFVQRRPLLASFGQAKKKGLLFYGPPGTGKTHTIRYLAQALEGHTTFLISAEQVARLADYMTLARLLQPSIVVIEDVDLIARDRNTMGACEEALLNKLLNEMDGLTPESDILFLLTTNRPEALEPALASRPGRIDQAIEFPLPDEAGREKLVRLYAGKAEVDEDLVRAIVKRTDQVSAAFIKELMRRSVQFHLETTESPRLELANVQMAIEEMVVTGGELNVKLLGAGTMDGGPRIGF